MVWVTDLKYKYKKIPIKLGVFIALLIFSASIIILLWIFQSVFLDDLYEKIKTHDADSAANYIAENVNSAELDILTARESNSRDVSVAVYDDDFQIVSSANAHDGGSIFRNMPPDQVQQFFLLASVSENRRYSEYFSGFHASESKISGKQTPSSDETTSYVVVQLVKSASEKTYTIISNTVITPVDSISQTLNYMLLLITVLVIFFSLIMALILSKNITKPIHKVSLEAEELAKGKYKEVKFSESKIKEINELAQSMNYMKSELGKIDNLQKELIANISHDLRTPLTLMTGYAEMMKDLPGEATEENLQVIIDEGKRMTALVSDALDLSKINAGVQPLSPERFDIIECIKSVIPQYNKLIEINDFKIILDTDVPSAFVYCDKNRILRVLYNLINNAINYAGADKEVIIKTVTLPGSITVHIIDHGEGIPADKIKDIWDRYYKIDKTHKRAAAGSGLGLSIVKKILSESNSDFGVSSKPGMGSDFWFTLELSGIESKQV